MYDGLRLPFEPKFIQWKINNRTKDKTKAKITFHVDARAVQHRFNDLLGVEGWSFDWEKQEGGAVKGTIRLHLGGIDVSKSDVGYPNSEISSEPLKDAVSDALKRSAVHYGVGAFLYALPDLWIDIDPQQKYLNAEQNQYIRSWILPHLERMTKVVTKGNNENQGSD